MWNLWRFIEASPHHYYQEFLSIISSYVRVPRLKNSIQSILSVITERTWNCIWQHFRRQRGNAHFPLLRWKTIISHHHHIGFRTVLMTLRNLDLDVEIIHVNFQKGENKSDAFTALNPLQQVPVLVEEDGFVLTESRAIAAYLVASHAPTSSLYPLNDPVKRALVDERLYFDATTVFFSHIQILVIFSKGKISNNFNET